MWKAIQTACLILATFSYLRAQSPTDLTANVALTAPTQTDFAPNAFFSSPAQIASAFNAGRRAEETQLGLPANSLGTLTLPASYASSTPSERALFLLNAERQARAGVNYGSGPILGLPVQGIESTLASVAQNHANDMTTNNFFGHTGSNGSTPPQRIRAAFPNNCAQFMTYSENIYVACGTVQNQFPYLVEQALFSWLYRDSGSFWGHRRALLIQNADAYGATGYNNDYGSAASEGIIGFGFSSSSTYSSTCGSSFPVGSVVVLNVADPSPACSYNILSSALPVHLIQFTGVARTGKVTLGWSTAWEQTNQGFDVQKSFDARSWEAIGFVAGQGSTTESTFYSFDDENVLPGETYYYRLKQKDADNQFAYSKVVAVTMETGFNALYLYPNPSPNGAFRIVADALQDVVVEVYNAAGLVVPTHQEALHSKAISVVPRQPLAPGLYKVRVRQGDGQAHRLFSVLVN